MKTVTAAEEPDPYRVYRLSWQKNMRQIASALRKSAKFGGRR